MKSAIIIFWSIAILLLIPLILYGIKCAIKGKKDKDFSYPAYKIAAAMVLSILVIVSVIKIYKFTIGYQAPLAAEAFLLKGGYEKLLDAGFDRGEYKVYFSEAAYENDDGSLRIFLKFEKGEEEDYTFIDMQKSNNKWAIISHNIITGSHEDYPETGKRFYLVGEKILD